jgi:hypothetical protein
MAPRRRGVDSTWGLLVEGKFEDAIRLHERWRYDGLAGGLMMRIMNPLYYVL